MMKLFATINYLFFSISACHAIFFFFLILQRCYYHIIKQRILGTDQDKGPVTSVLYIYMTSRITRYSSFNKKNIII